MRELQCDAILLRAVDFGESDRVVHFLTQEEGRLTAMAKGARRSRRRFPGTLDVFNRLRIEGRRKPRAAMAFLTKAVLVDPYLGLRENAARYALASFLTEMLDRMAPEGVPGPEVARLFRFASESLSLIEAAEPTPTLRVLLELRAYDALGLRPALGRCVRCGRVPSEETRADHVVSFFVPDGGIVCTACGIPLDGLIPLDMGTLRTLEHGLSVPLETLPRLALGRVALTQAERMLFRFQRFHVGVELRSDRFLGEMLSGSGAGPA